MKSFLFFWKEVTLRCLFALKSLQTGIWRIKTWECYSYKSTCISGMTTIKYSNFRVTAEKHHAFWSAIQCNDPWEEMVQLANNWEIAYMVGLECGFPSKHIKAIFITDSSLSWTLVDGGKGLWSKTSFTRSRISRDEDGGLEIKSPGCAPMITSIVNTPKL